MDLISIIVPVYKVEPYLDACVTSIVNQTYNNLEIILVDDGSPDRCPAMCDAWAARDPRIRVIHKENGGLSSARNAGMAIATGDYFGFVDSDDQISPEMYAHLYELSQLLHADIVQCGVVKFSDAAPLKFSVCENADTQVYSAKEAVEALLTSGKVDVTCWNMLVSQAVASVVLFDEGRINEDVLWTYRTIARSKKIAVTSAPLYGYYQRDGSIMNSVYTEKRFDALYALEQRAKEIKRDFPELYPFAERSFAGGCMYHCQWLCRLPDTEEYRAFRKQLHAKFVQADLKAVYSVTGLKYRLWYTLFCYWPTVICKIRNLLKIGL
ncbi:MAG: glycosyltransferase [Clostridia bacterium]|nr:glycosyltransferase [Clostridia bacterium]